MRLFNKKAPVVWGQLPVSNGRLCKIMESVVKKTQLDKQSTFFQNVSLRRPVKEIMLKDLSINVG